MNGVQNESRWQMTARIWLMPLLAALMAALGSYVGVVRAIEDLRSEIRVVRAEHRAAIDALRHRLATVEERTPPDATSQRDLMALREKFDQGVRQWLERHEQVYHHQRRSE